MDNTTLIKWFKKNRRKKKDFQFISMQIITYKIQLIQNGLLSRQQAIKLLLKLRIKSAPN